MMMMMMKDSVKMRTENHVICNRLLGWKGSSERWRKPVAGVVRWRFAADGAYERPRLPRARRGGPCGGAGAGTESRRWTRSQRTAPARTPALCAARGAGRIARRRCRCTSLSGVFSARRCGGQQPSRASSRWWHSRRTQIQLGRRSFRIANLLHLLLLLLGDLLLGMILGLLCGGFAGR